MKSVKLILFVVLVGVSGSVFADFLVVNRKTSIKSGPSSQSTIHVQVQADDTLALLDDGKQSNGYYHVKSPRFTGEGWIYRTFVRRYHGQPEGWNETGDLLSLNEKVEVRIVDVGAGQCNLIKLPQDKFVIYDAGGGSKRTLLQVVDFIPAGSNVELFVLSHTDKDHIAAASAILKTYRVKRILWTGYNIDSTSVFSTLKETLKNLPYPIENVNLRSKDSTIVPGTKIQIGRATFNFLCGFGRPRPDWKYKDNILVNAVSIVMKLEYGSKSILFCGDAVGRTIGDPPNTLIATEKFLIENSSSFLNSDIIVAPHHGADNGSSNAFIAKVSPTVVIFSSGHMHYHPYNSTALRYINNHVDINNIFRTDRGDDEQKPGKPYPEWPHMRIKDCPDPPADDDIQIDLPFNKMYSVYYLYPNETCEDVD